MNQRIKTERLQKHKGPPDFVSSSVPFAFGHMVRLVPPRGFCARCILLSTGCSSKSSYSPHQLVHSVTKRERKKRIKTSWSFQKVCSSWIHYTERACGFPPPVPLSPAAGGMEAPRPSASCPHSGFQGQLPPAPTPRSKMKTTCPYERSFYASFWLIKGKIWFYPISKVLPGRTVASLENSLKSWQGYPVNLRALLTSGKSQTPQTDFPKVLSI